MRKRDDRRAGKQGSVRVGVVVKSVIALGSVYFAMFRGELPAARVAPAETAAFCAAAAAANAPAPAAAAPCARMLSEKAREALLVAFQRQSARPPEAAAQAGRALVAADLADPWYGPPPSRKRKIAKSARVASGPGKG